MIEIMGFNPIKLTSGIATKNNNTTAYVKTYQNAYIGGFAINRIPPNKKTYFEYKILELKNDAASVGIADFNNILPYSTTYRNFVKSVWQYLKDGTVMNPKQYGSSYGSRYSIGDIIGVKVNLIDYQIEFTKNGVSCGIVPTPLDPTHEYYPYFVDYNVDVNIDLVKIIEKKDEMLYLPEGYEPLIKKPNKFLIKQNHQYLTIKSEFYKNGNYVPIADLQEKEILTKNDFETYGIDDLNPLTKNMDTQYIKGTDKGNLGNGKLFELNLDSEFLSINMMKDNIEKYTANLIPIMSSNSNPYCTLSTSSKWQSEPFNAVDGTDKFCRLNSTVGTWTIKFSEPKIISKYSGYFANSTGNCSENWNFEASNDDTSWDILHEVKNNSSRDKLEHKFYNKKKYIYYRFNFFASRYDAVLNNIEMHSMLENKFLIKENNKYYTIDNTYVVLAPSQILDEHNFNNNGFTNIDLITKDLLLNKFENLKEIKLLAYTDDLEKNKCEMIYNCQPFRPIDKLKKNSDICNILFKEV